MLKHVKTTFDWRKWWSSDWMVPVSSTSCVNVQPHLGSWSPSWSTHPDTLWGVSCDKLAEPFPWLAQCFPWISMIFLHSIRSSPLSHTNGKNNDMRPITFVSCILKHGGPLGNSSIDEIFSGKPRSWLPEDVLNKQFIPLYPMYVSKPSPILP